ncbi:MAG: protein kinase [Steroidobacteraceae bacterium]|nr:protein kinase [Steroidobacteraceae bacterium]
MTEKINIAGYTIERKLGQGGMATVFLAIQQSFEREVALKIMSPLLNSDPSFTTRFLREARIVANIHHASIVPVYDVGERHPFHYLSMEYLPGGDLKQRILKGRCEPGLVVDCCIAICGALDVAHRKGFVHRDIKPENILFREDGTPVLTDFGIARALDRGASLTVAGMIVGTPSYMSPEQVKGIELDGRSDLYSLGIVCYEMLTGTVPFRADSSMSVAIKHLIDPMPKLPPELCAYQPFIDRLTAKDRNERYATGSDAAQALRSICRAANKANATTLMPRPTEVTELLPKPEGPSRVTLMLASARSVGPRIRSILPRIRAIWTGLRERLFQRAALPWIGGWAALAAITVAVGIFMARSEPTASVVTATATPSIATPVPEVVAPEPELAIVTETPLESEVPADGAGSDPAADIAALEQQKAADAREKKKARQRLAEIEKENQAVARRQEEELIQRLLAAARQAYAIGAYTRPAGDSAADRYREILSFRPNHADATAGLRRIADLRAEEARRALAVSDADKARSLIDDVANLQPDHPALTDLQVGMTSLEVSPQQQGRKQAVALERANRHIQKAYRHLERKPFDQKAADLASDEYDNAVAQMSMAPDLPALKERIMASYSEIVRAEIRDSDAKGAQRMISYARKRKWMTAELEELELAVKQAAPAQALGAK